MRDINQWDGGKTPGGSGGLGDVVGPGSAVDSNFAAFDATTGKLIKDSGKKATDFATAGHNHAGVYEPHATILTTFAGLASSAGWLHNDGAGALTYSTPGYADVGAAPAFAAGLANLFWGTPNGAPGVPSLRALVAADIPALSYQPAASSFTPSVHNILDSAYHGDVLTDSVLRGDILYGNSTPKIARLAHGIAGAFLTGDGTDTAWSTWSLAGTAAQTYTFPAVGGTVALLNAANVFTAAQTIVSGNNSTGLLIASFQTEDLEKYASILGSPYHNEDGNYMAFMGYGAVGHNYIRYGGGTSNAKAATRQVWYTAADTTTVKGTGRLYLNEVGHFQFGTLGTFNTIPALVFVMGSADEVQLIAQAYSSQTQDIFQIRDSVGNILDRFDYTGNLLLGAYVNTGFGTPLPNKVLNVWGDQGTLNPATVGSECITNGTITSPYAGWTVTGDFTLATNRANYAHSTGTGTLTQLAARMSTAILPNRWYKLTYVISGVTAGCTATLSGVCASMTIDVTTGTKTLYFKSASSPGDFVITGTSTAGAFRYDTVSMKEVQGGDVTSYGKLLGGGTLGEKIDSAGNAIFDANLTVLGSFTALFMDDSVISLDDDMVFL